MGNKKIKGDVYWYFPNRKKPIAYSTKAVADTIDIFSSEYETINDVYNALDFMGDEKDILRLYIDAGYGNIIAKELFPLI